MGEEYGETVPFLYFVHHSDKDLIEAVRKGRREEFARFGWQEEPPDPQAEKTFLDSKISFEKLDITKRKVLFKFYQVLIALRKEIRGAGLFSDRVPDVKRFGNEKVILVGDYRKNNGIFCLFSFQEKITSIEVTPPAGQWNKIFDTSLPCWGEKVCETAPSRIASRGSTMKVTIQPWGALVYRLDNRDR